jgi:hypothetical protein
MTSFRQIAANRLNALRSTGPRTQEGKHQSRRNARRHGLTAETVIDALEDTQDYPGFEAAIISDFDAQTAVQRELVLRLASLLWRLRRIISIETDMFQIQAEILRDRGDDVSRGCNEFQVQAADDTICDGPDQLNAAPVSMSARALTVSFLRLGNLDNGAFERLGRYKAALWKQAAQTLFLLQSIRHR